ncbi:MAG TPA: hypothetical protein QKA08_02875 [Candidatus Megaira endosymbiont of Nemacystus decipiens]|nr:hypothetical protein [Candidatus Megaera endosymbiont of Nemacystus decipiens]
MKKLTEDLKQSVNTEDTALSPAEKRSFLQKIKEIVVKIITYLNPYKKNPEVKNTLDTAEGLNHTKHSKQNNKQTREF